MGRARSVDQIMEAVAARSQWAQYHGEIIDGLRTGYVDFDNKTWGLRPRGLTVVAGDADSPRDWFVEGVSRHVALHEHKPVLHLTLRSDAEELAQRLLVQQTGLDLDKFRSGAFTPDEWRQVHDAKKAFSLTTSFPGQQQLIELDPVPMPVNVVADATLDLDDVCREIAHAGDVALVVIDGLERLVDNTIVTDRSALSQHVFTTLADVAADHDVHVLGTLLVHGDEHGLRRRDFNDHPAVFEFADVVMTLHRPENWHLDTPDRGLVRCRIMRNRGRGSSHENPLGTMDLAVLDHRCGLHNIAKG